MRPELPRYWRTRPTLQPPMPSSHCYSRTAPSSQPARRSRFSHTLLRPGGKPLSARGPITLASLWMRSRRRATGDAAAYMDSSTLIQAPGSCYQRCRLPCPAARYPLHACNIEYGVSKVSRFESSLVRARCLAVSFFRLTPATCLRVAGRARTRAENTTRVWFNHKSRRFLIFA